MAMMVHSVDNLCFQRRLCRLVQICITKRLCITGVFHLSGHGVAALSGDGQPNLNECRNLNERPNLAEYMRTDQTSAMQVIHASHNGRVGWSAAVAVMAFTLLATTPLAAFELPRTFDEGRIIAVQAWQLSVHWALDHYATTPALMVGLIAVLALPPLALASGLITRLTMPRRTPTLGYLGQHPGQPSTAPDHPSNMAWPREAWLTVQTRVDPSGPPPLHRMPRELLSIGRGDDNDVVLDEPTVHRYHALIQRTPDALFLIKDIAGPDGNGVSVNDERVTEAHLLDGDRIALGTALLLFHTRRVGITQPLAETMTPAKN
jgi:hypothetical protein